MLIFISVVQNHYMASHAQHHFLPEEQRVLGLDALGCLPETFPLAPFDAETDAAIDCHLGRKLMHISHRLTRDCKVIKKIHSADWQIFGHFSMYDGPICGPAVQTERIVCIRGN